mgnify:CR=1 FL=1
MIDTVSEKKFNTLKKRLEALHYCQPITIESASLVEKLLNDLIKTTEGFQNLKKMNEELKSAQFKGDQITEPLKRENARLLKENNELHYEVMKIKEEAEFKDSKIQSALKTIDGERNELKFLIQQKESAMKKLEEDVS